MTRWKAAADRCRCGNAVRVLDRWCMSCAKREADERVGRAVKRRDKRCQNPECRSMYRGEWAHILGRGRAPRLRWVLINAVQLCHECHGFFTRAGDQTWVEFIEAILPGRWEELLELERSGVRADVEDVLTASGVSA